MKKYFEVPEINSVVLNPEADVMVGSLIAVRNENLTAWSGEDVSGEFEMWKGFGE